MAFDSNKLTCKIDRQFSFSATFKIERTCLCKNMIAPVKNKVKTQI